jgi:hypothetical protein
MGFLNRFAKASPGVRKLPSGTITLDREGRIVTSTVSSTFDSELLQEIGRVVLKILHDAVKAQLPLSELVFHFGSLQITAREMRGGAIIFLKPKDAFGIVAKS